MTKISLQDLKRENKELLHVGNIPTYFSYSIEGLIKCVEDRRKGLVIVLDYCDEFIKDFNRPKDQRVTKVNRIEELLAIRGATKEAITKLDAAIDFGESSG